MNNQEAQDAIATFRSQFNAKKIRTVCGWAKATESKSRYAVAAKDVAELKKQIAASEDGGLQRMRLEGELKIMEARASEYSTQAQEAARNAWRTHDALQLVERDLERFSNDLSAAVEAGTKAMRKFYVANGWGSPSDETILSTVAPLAAMKQFLKEHAEPALQTFRAQLAISAAGQRLGDSFQPDALASWLVFGCGWREIPMT
jgi:hypothetical protein